MKLQPEEQLVKGSWVYANGSMQEDDQCRRIEWLIKTQLRQIASSPVFGDWETLFQDPTDGRYWERTYPQGDMHGGGPPELHLISEEDAKTKYKL